MTADLVPYPAIERHGVIGDRRTAALVAADGTISWWCLPNYDGAPVLGALIDAGRGGFWRLGPATPVLGRQRYIDRTAILATAWDDGVEITDAMLWPEVDRSPVDEPRRVVLRRLRSTKADSRCVMALQSPPRFWARRVA